MVRPLYSLLGAAMLSLAACTSESTVHLQSDDKKKSKSGGGDPGLDTADTGSHSDGTDSGTSTGDPCKDNDPVIEIGTGEELFESLDEGDRIEVIHGAQDGHHILGSVRARNTTGIATIHFDITPDYTGESISAQVYRLQMLPDPIRGDCAWIITGLFAYLGRIDPSGAPFLNQSAAMRMDLVDDDGRSASDQVNVIPYLPVVEF